MRSKRCWWLGVMDAGQVRGFERHARLEFDLDGDAQEALAALLEHEVVDGDDVLVADDAGRWLRGAVSGEARRRRRFRCEAVARVVALRPIGFPDGLPAALAALAAVPAGTALEEGPMHALDGAACADEARGEGDALPVFRIDTAPPAIPLPQIDNLYQSPYADRILRDFRWREYLHANPDVAATGHDEAHAFTHFFQQGYYERRIFDPKRLQGFDGGYYRSRYPELGLQTDAEAQVHYCYQGWYEGRIANEVTGWLHDARLHVFQMGKVGSHSIAAGLEVSAWPHGAVHLHWVTDLVHGYPGNHLPYPKLLVHPRDTPVKVISATRELVSWTLASLFQGGAGAPLHARDAMDYVERHFWHLATNGARWFDHQYFCGLDVYRDAFPHADGFTRIAFPGIDLMIYRQEDMPRLEGAFARFLDIPSFTLGAHNVGKQKAYADVYAAIRRGFRMPGNTLARLYDTPFMRHFYSDDERQAFYTRWAGS